MGITKHFASNVGKIIALIVAAILLYLAAAYTVVGLGIVKPAHAGTCTIVGGVTVCGKISVSPSSTYGVHVTETWPALAGHTTYVAPGGKSPYKDTDGFFVRANCKTTALNTVGKLSWTAGSTGYWVKITDNQNYYLYVGSCT